VHHASLNEILNQFGQATVQRKLVGTLINADKKKG
jgi:hypothetical protein